MAVGSPGATPTSGTARGEDNYILSRRLLVELGVNRALIRSTSEAGHVRLTADATGLASATLDIDAKATTPALGGLTDCAEEAQPADLSRRSTPPGDSVVQRARTVAVASLIAGSGVADAAKSHDDNEAITWPSDGTPANAWIEHRFARPERASALLLRLTGCRLRFYPIRVMLDWRTIWEGETPTSLGYVNLPVTAATAGGRLRITLIRPTTDRNAFGNIVEIKSARAGGDTGADAMSAGWWLSIVEANILKPPTSMALSN